MRSTSRPKLGLEMWWPGQLPARAEYRIQVLAFALYGFCQEFKEMEQNLKSRIRRVLAEVGGTNEVEQVRVQNPESTDVEWRQESTTRIRIQNVKSLHRYFEGKWGDFKIQNLKRREREEERAKYLIRGDCRIRYDSEIDYHSIFRRRRKGWVHVRAAKQKKLWVCGPIPELELTIWVYVYIYIYIYVYIYI